MTGFRYFLHIAFHNALGSGQRGVVALLCIAFGVMSLVAMLLVAESIGSMLQVDARHQLGADAILARAQDQSIPPVQLAQLADLQARGVLESYTPTAFASALLFRIPPSAQVKFVSNGIGIVPPQYPLVGAMTFSEPPDETFIKLLQNPDDVVITRDLAALNHLGVGDTLILSDLAVGIPVTVHIRGIIADTPNHQGDTIYYTLATADALADGPAINRVYITTNNRSAAESALSTSGWETFWDTDLEDNRRQGQGLVDLLLKGAGILALLVGGIGIANTMQVLLQRRRREVAIWKTLGYRTTDLYLLFGVEAALFGVAGSIIGAFLGLGVSVALTDLFARTTVLLFAWTWSPLPLLVGVIAGIVTTILFALWAIVRVSRVQPMALLRNEPISAARVEWWRSVALAIMLAIPFTILASWILGSPLQAVGVLLFAVFGMILLTLVLGGAGLLVTRVLPFGRVPLFRIAQNSLRRRGASLLFAMMALFVGVIALGFGFVFTQNAGRALDARTFHLTGYNAVIIAPATQAASVADVLGSTKTATLAQVPVRRIRATGARADTFITPELIIATEPHNYKLNGAAWDSAADGAYANVSAMLPIGATVEIETQDGTIITKTIVGSYTSAQNPTTLWTSNGLLLPQSDANKIFAPQSLRIYAELEPARLAELSNMLHNATVIDLAAYAARFTVAYQNLFVLAVAMASLAFLAGILLIANSVSLAMLDRRFEIGVLKTIGYTQHHVITTLLVEYGIIALLVSFIGVLCIQITLTLLGIANPLAARLLSMDARDMFVIIFVTLGLTLLTVLAVVWQPIRVSPILSLNDRA